MPQNRALPPRDGIYVIKNEATRQVLTIDPNAQSESALTLREWNPYLTMTCEFRVERMQGKGEWEYSLVAAHNGLSPYILGNEEVPVALHAVFPFHLLAVVRPGKLRYRISDSDRPMEERRYIVAQRDGFGYKPAIVCHQSGDEAHYWEFVYRRPIPGPHANGSKGKGKYNNGHWKGKSDCGWDTENGDNENKGRGNDNRGMNNANNSNWTGGRGAGKKDEAPSIWLRIPTGAIEIHASGCRGLHTK